jgi:hypothetical protein
MPRAGCYNRTVLQQDSTAMHCRVRVNNVKLNIFLVGSSGNGTHVKYNQITFESSLNTSVAFLLDLEGDVLTINNVTDSDHSGLGTVAISYLEEKGVVKKNDVTIFQQILCCGGSYSMKVHCCVYCPIKHW